MAYLPPTSHVTLLAMLRRERLLPIPGEVIVNPGQRVESTDVVAHAEIPAHHRLLDVARALGVPKDKAASFVVKQEGELVKKGEPIAQRKRFLGLGNLPVPSPVDGRLVLFDEGKALLAALTTYELRAGLPGTVASVIAGRGILVEATGALLEGLWGNGRDDFSVLRMLSSAPDAPLLGEQLELSLRGAILAAGWIQDPALFKTLTDVGVRGLILGSAPADLLADFQSLNFPVLVVDRFGSQGFSQPAFNLLSGNTGREVWLNAHPADRYAGTRPEAIIPLPAGHEPPPPPVEGEALAEGKRVRVARGPDAGRVGAIIGLSDRAVPLENGIRAFVAAVALDEPRGSRPTVTVPFANLELLE
jgi:hypothetical protein